MRADERGWVKSRIPPGASGPWVVERVSLPPRPIGIDDRPSCFHFRAGDYTCLRRELTTYMTDLYDEWWTQRRGIDEAATRGGRILVTGLGLGLVAEAMLASPEVSAVSVLESEADVIRLVAPSLRAHFGSRLEVIHGDAFSWSPPSGASFSVGWHDIWPDPYGAEVAAEVARLESRYATYCDWQGSWPSEYLRECREGAGA